MAMCLSSQELLASERHDGADRLAPMHEIECIVDLFERHHVGDEIVYVDLLVHVPVDDPGNVGAAPCPPEPGALPPPAGHELEWPGLDPLSGPRDPDVDRHAPAAVTAFEGLAHEIHVADALETIVRPAVGEGYQVLHQIAPHFLRVDEMGHPEALGQRLAPRIQVDADDLVGADQARSLNDVEADAAQAEHDDIGARLDLRGVYDRTDAGGHAATDVAHLLERRVLANLGEGDLRQHGVVGEGRTSHVVVDHL